MSATEYRAQFDAVVTFANGGGLRTEGFRIDVPGPDVSPQEAARFFITSLNLLMVESVEVNDLRVFAEPHKGTRGGASDLPGAHRVPDRCGHHGRHPRHLPGQPVSPVRGRSRSGRPAAGGLRRAAGRP